MRPGNLVGNNLESEEGFCILLLYENRQWEVHLTCCVCFYICECILLVDVSVSWWTGTGMWLTPVMDRGQSRAGEAERGSSSSLGGHELLNFRSRNISATGRKTRRGSVSLKRLWHAGCTVRHPHTQRLLLCPCVSSCSLLLYIYLSLLFYLSLIAHLSLSVLPSIHLPPALSVNWWLSIKSLR